MDLQHAALVVRGLIQFYLLFTFVQMTRLLRKYDLIKNYRSILLAGFAYFFYLGQMILPCFIYPSIRWKIATSDYECTETEKHHIAFFMTWEHFAAPICYFLPFFGLLF
jgi:hypothetical protein